MGAVPCVIAESIKQCTWKRDSRWPLHTVLHPEGDGCHPWWVITEFEFFVHRQSVINNSAPSLQQAANKKGMRLMCSCPSFARYRQTPLKERLKELISRLWICRGVRANSIHNKRKHKCFVLLLCFGEFQQKGQSCHAFLAYAYFTLVSGCKDTNKILIHTHPNKKIFIEHKLSRIYHKFIHE